MEVKIGIQSIPRELVVETDATAEEIERDLQADPKKLPRSLWFKNCGGYTVDTTAGAKTALREASALRALHKLPWQGGGEEALSVAYHGARAALVAKGLTQEEIDTIEARAAKAAVKRGY